MPTFRLAARIALRELRGGVGGLWIVLLCLALGVAAIAAVGTLGAAVAAGLAADGRRILGGDIEVSASARDLPAELKAALAERGPTAEIAEMRAMLARPDAPGRPSERLLVELKAVTPAWPLYGEALAGDGRPAQAALAAVSGVPAVLLEQVVLDRLGVGVGAEVRLGEATFRVAGSLALEPDRVAHPALFGARALIAWNALAATRLVQPGSLVRFAVRLALPPGSDPVRTIAELRGAFPDGGLRWRSAGEAAPGVAGLVGRTELFLTLVGLSALLVGGIGVANGVGAWLLARRRSIATLKCLGASARLIALAYGLQLGLLAAGGILAALVIGAVLPFGLAGLLGDALPVPPRVGIYPLPLALAGLYGVLCAACFALWPLARAREIPAIALFRDQVAPIHARPRAGWIVANALLAAALAALVVGSTGDRIFAAWFAAAAAATLALFRLGGVVLQRLAKRFGHVRQVALRLGLANLHRPGTPAPLMLVSIGLGLSVLAAVALIQANLAREITERMPDGAPSFFFIDIQPDQVARFDAIAAAGGANRVQRVPSLRARIVALNGVPVEKARVAPEAQWALNGDRGLTYAATPPPGSQIVAGSWWPADYRGPPLVSFDAGLAHGMGLSVGDRITVNVLGRDIALRIANLRRIDWRSLGMNFSLVASPGLLEAAPHTHIATVFTTPAAEAALQRQVSEALPNVSAIRVRDALAAVAALVARLGAALEATGAVALVAGGLVLAGAVAAGQRARIRDGVLLKVLGASRRQIRATFLVEFLAVGLSAGLIAALVGTAAAWAVTVYVMGSAFVFRPLVLGVTILAGMLMAGLFGWAGTGRALRTPAGPLLRNE